MKITYKDNEGVKDGIEIVEYTMEDALQDLEMYKRAYSNQQYEYAKLQEKYNVLKYNCLKKNEVEEDE